HNGFATPIVGRLRVGVTRAQAQAQFETLARHFSNWSGEKLVSGVLPLKELLVGNVRRPLQVFAAAVVFVLLIACANVANLLFARAARREREIAVRAALGASRGRLVRQLLTESVLLSLAGGTFGMVLAGWAVAALLALAREGRIRRVALALVLLTGAGLMLQSFLRLRAIDPGFHPHNVMTLTVDLPESTYPTAERMHAFHSAFLERLGALPGVIDASAVNWRPLGTMLIHGDFHAEGPTSAAADSTADKLAVGPGYFRTMGIRLLRGRDFTARDNASSAGVAILSQAVARMLEPSGDAIGRRLTLEDHPKSEDWLTVIGVVDDVRQWGPAQPLHAAIYQPYPQVRQPILLR